MMDTALGDHEDGGPRLVRFDLTEVPFRHVPWILGKDGSRDDREHVEALLFSVDVFVGWGTLGRC